ncbi:uncharacterized protein FOMMEDRAFT_166245 [Fomitiporia mediterranea MF3/22]|uniref:uncharacterized protein n=1 Tax=Fomitiporia mediterranea (strain MF3/22) TaxID=694068 RepID=UPI0004409299|nr:uncharacterized protein FOMMEDRAFT_166245 [Fomitiporia mediterranea MF3/22]EJD05940.1 hypothetical protein FOMMEDRAFT_166245 [Fomitiporia mediterranea MF3/22]
MSSSVRSVQAAIQALKKAAAKGKTKKSVLENIDNLSTSTVLLNSSSPSSQSFEKLISVFRAPLIPLYLNYTELSLNVASAVLKTVLNNSVCSFPSGNIDHDKEKQSGWEQVAHSLLSGVIDFLENDGTDKSKSRVAKAFFGIICEFFFKGYSAEGDIGGKLRFTAYTLLSEASTLHHDNQSKLRDPKLLGPRALGEAILKTRGKETLLNLFAILLPSASVGRDERHAFIQDVFTTCGETVSDLLEGAQTGEWDETSTKVVDILAASDISFPQPFDVGEVIVCGNKYPQPEISDRFYVDKTSFLVNVRQEDDMYEEMQIPYAEVQDIKTISLGDKSTRVSVLLKTAPKIGDQVISTHREPLILLVEILNKDLSRFKEALLHRKLEKDLEGRKQSRVSVSASLDLDEDTVRRQRNTQSPSQNAKNIESFYDTDILQSLSDKAKCRTTAVITDGKLPRNKRVAKAGPKEAEDSVRQATAPILDASRIAETGEELSEIDMDKPGNVSVKARTARDKKEDEGRHETTHEPSKSIVLPKGETALKIKKKVRRGKEAKERTQICLDSDAEVSLNPEIEPERKNTIEVPRENVEEFALETDAPRHNRDPASRKTDQKSGTARSTEDPSVRPRRAAAALASARLAKKIDNSDNLDVIDVRQTNDDSSVIFNSEGKPRDITRDREKRGVKALEPAAKLKTQSTMPAVRPPSPLQAAMPRSSSPLSKISRMKAKKTVTDLRPTNAKGQKRTSDDVFSVDVQEAAPPKKSRIDVEIDTGNKKNARSRPPPTYTHRGRKAKGPPVREESPVDWDRLPKQASTTVKNRQPESPEPAAPPRDTNRGKRAVKKENIVMPKGKTTGAQTTKQSTKVSENESRPRIPLQTVDQISNEALEETKHIHLDQSVPRRDPAGMLTKCWPANTITSNENTKTINFPSLSEVLLGGAVVKESEAKPRKTIEVDREAFSDDNDGDNVETEFNLQQHDTPPSFAHGSESNDGLVNQSDVEDDEITKRHGAPHTPPLPQAKSHSPVIEAVVHRRPKEITALDDEPIDLTDDDIKEALRSLRLRRTEKAQELQKASRPQKSIHKSLVTVVDQESSDEDRAQAEVLSHPRVKFDERLRYKLDPLENPSARGPTASRVTLPGKKPRVTNGKPASRNGNAVTSRESQENQPKEPGMAEIINVLDRIQNVIVSNISNKSRAVRSDIRAARDRILQEAATDLQEMREESIGHYNNLLVLENEYANIGRKLNAGFDALTNVNSDICQFIQQSINAHNRGSLLRKMPQSLFGSALPQSFLQFN